MSWRHGLAAGELLLERPPLKSVLLALAHHANEYTCRCWPSVERIALFTGLSRRSVQYALADLVGLELLKVHERPGKPSLYELTLPDCEPLDQGGLRAHHGKKGGAPLAQGGAAGAPEDSVMDNDARVSTVFSEEWRPTPAIIERIKADEGMDDEAVERELKLFILKNSENAVPKPHAAFRMWCARLKSLNNPPPLKAGKPVAPVDERTPDQRAEDFGKHLETRATDHSRFDPDRASELWLEATKWWDKMPGHDEDARRCVTRAYQAARKDSYHQEQVEKWAVGRWGADWRNG